MQIKTFDPTEWNMEKFIIGRRLGNGQYGTVYLAKQKQTKMILALKLLNKKKIVSNNAISQIRRQIEIHSHLQHQNILTMYGYFHNNKNIAVMMEYAPHGDLYGLMKIQDFTQQTIKNYMLQMVKAVHYLQSLNIIHRDIKPENILVSENNTLKLSDFGWSIKTTSSHRTTFCGTPDYFCPEIVKYIPFDYKIDNWSLGILAYELLYKRTPFYSNEEKKLLKNILHREISFPEHVSVSDEFKDFVLRLTNKDPKQRMELQEALKHPWLQQKKKKKVQWLEDIMVPEKN